MGGGENPFGLLKFYICIYGIFFGLVLRVRSLLEMGYHFWKFWNITPQKLEGYAW